MNIEQQSLHTFIRICNESEENMRLRVSFLPRDAMLARYSLSSCVRPSVRYQLSVHHKPVLYRNNWTNRAGSFHGLG